MSERPTDFQIQLAPSSHRLFERRRLQSPTFVDDRLLALMDDVSVGRRERELLHFLEHRLSPHHAGLKPCVHFERNLLRLLRPFHVRLRALGEPPLLPNPPRRHQRTWLHPQIVIPMSRELFDQIWRDASQLRAYVDRCMFEHPELFPPCLLKGYAFHGFGRSSRKLDGIRLRKIRPADDSEAYHLRPSFVMNYMTKTTDNVEFPLLLASFGVPYWVLTLVGLGHNDMFWHRLIERLGRDDLVGTTVRDPSRLPRHLAADEHHVAAYGEFAKEANDMDPTYAPETVNTDGWAATRNAF